MENFREQCSTDFGSAQEGCTFVDDERKADYLKEVDAVLHAAKYFGIALSRKRAEEIVKAEFSIERYERSAAQLLNERRAAKAQYAREWRRKNPEKAAAIYQRYWEKKAGESHQQTEGQKGGRHD